MKNNNLVVKPHPFTFYTYLSRFLYLLIIPFLQQLLINPQSFWGQIGTTTLNSVFIIVIVWVAVLEFKSVYYRQTKDVITFRKGAFITKSVRLPINQVSVVYLHANPLYRFFSSVKVHITTNSLIDKSGFTFICSKRQSDKILNRMINDRNRKEVYKTSFIRIFFMSLTWSNTITGLLVLSPFINRIGTILGEEYKDMIYETMDLTDYLVKLNLPPALASIAGILLAGYVIAVVIQIMRFGNFKVFFTGEKLIIPKGIGIKSCFMVDADNINGFTVKQSLLMAIFKIYTVYMHTLSNSRIKGDNSMLIPIANKKGVSDIISSIHPQDGEHDFLIKPKKRMAASYLWFPLTVFAGVIILGVLMYKSAILDAFADLFLLLFIPVGLILIVFRAYVFSRCSISVGEKTVKIKNYKRVNFTLSVIPNDKVEGITIKRTFIQRISGTCHVVVTVRSSYQRKFIVKSLDYKDAVRLVKEFNSR